MSDVGILQAHLASFGVQHYTETLLRNGFNCKNLGILTESDLRKLRITSKHERRQLLAIAALFNKDSLSSSDQPSETRRVRESGLLQPTAADCCRSAANYIAFRRVDRVWPRPASSLAVNVGLSTADGRAVSSPRELFTVRTIPQHQLTEVNQPKSSRSRSSSAKARWATVTQFNVEHGPVAQWAPPTIASLGADPEVVTVMTKPGHYHGQQSTRCECCDQHVKENSASFSGGQWQYQVKETIVVSHDVQDHVFMWRPFAAAESMMIENAWRKQLPTVKIGGVLLNFTDMTWKGTKVRRNSDYSVAFPSLSKREINEAPAVPMEEVERLEKEFADAYLRLVETAENQGRSKILLDEESSLLRIRGIISAEVQETYRREREQLEDEEASNRTRLETVELEDDIDKLWECFEKGMEQAVLAMNTRAMKEEADALCQHQRNVLFDLEAIDRVAVEDAESAEWANYCKLIARFNAQIFALLAGANDTIAPITGVRCPICNKSDCRFFLVKWSGHWPRKVATAEGSRSKSSLKGGCMTVSGLMAEVQEAEYSDFLKQYPSQQHQHHASVKPPSPRLYSPRVRNESPLKIEQSPRMPMRPFLCGAPTTYHRAGSSPCKANLKHVPSPPPRPQSASS